MYRREVPTHLSVEDKLFFGLTGRQVMLLIFAAILAYRAWGLRAVAVGHHLYVIPIWARLALMIVVLVVGALFTFVRYTYTAERWIAIFIQYYQRPRFCVWRRITATGVELEEDHLLQLAQTLGKDVHRTVDEELSG